MNLIPTPRSETLEAIEEIVRKKSPDCLFFVLLVSLDGKMDACGNMEVDEMTSAVSTIVNSKKAMENN